MKNSQNDWSHRYLVLNGEICSMNDKITASLYSQMEDLAKQFVGKYEIGISIEIAAFLEERDEIQKSHEFLDKDGYYIVDIYLKQFNMQNVKYVFSDLVCLLEYGDATLYTREMEKDVVHYTFSSLAKEGLRFACKVNFSQYVERA